jgi:hypothetical protein
MAPRFKILMSSGTVEEGQGCAALISDYGAKSVKRSRLEPNAHLSIRLLLWQNQNAAL